VVGDGAAPQLLGVGPVRTPVDLGEQLVDHAALADARDADERHELRLRVAGLVAYAGDAKLAREAKKLALAWLDGKRELPDDTVDAVLGVALYHADAALFDRILELDVILVGFDRVDGQGGNVAAPAFAELAKRALAR